MIFVPLEKVRGATDRMFGLSLFDKEASALAHLSSTLPFNEAFRISWENKPCPRHLGRVQDDRVRFLVVSFRT